MKHKKQQQSTILNNYLHGDVCTVANLDVRQHVRGTLGHKDTDHVHGHMQLEVSQVQAGPQGDRTGALVHTHVLQREDIKLIIQSSCIG